MYAMKLLKGELIMAIKVISTFDGISCGMVALQRANIKVDEYIAYEIDKYAIQVSAKNYPAIKHRGSVVNANFLQYKGFDLVIGGSPCQDLSIAKSGRQGLDGEKSKLFYEFVRAIKEVEPRYFLLENVASMSKESKQTITDILGVEPILINSALVSAQQRKRLYWTNIPGITQPEDKGLLLKDILDSGLSYSDKSYCLNTSYNNCVIRDSLVKKRRSMIFEPIKVCNVNPSGKGMNGVVYDINAKSMTLTTNKGEGNKILEPIKIGTVGCGSQGNRVYSIYGKSITVSAGMGGGHQIKIKVDLPDGEYIIRKLSPIECERLQTLEDDYTSGVSSAQRYKCLGNAWTVDVIAHIFSFIKEVE